MPAPTWSNVVLRLTCDGANNSTTFTDVSAAGHTVTAYGNAKVSTAQSKWGGASLYLDGTEGTYLGVGSSSQFNFGTLPWMVACWVRPSSAALASSTFLFDFWRTSPDERTELGTDDSPYPIGYDTTVGTLAGNAAASFTADTWQHLAYSWDGTTLRAFIDGVVAMAETVSIDITTARALKIGENYSPDTMVYPLYPFTGYVDDIIVVKGEAVYTSAFTPPTGAYDTSGSVSTLSAYISVPSMLGSPQLLGRLFPIGYVSDSGPLGAPSCVAWHDFTTTIAERPSGFVMDLVTSTATVRAPISSWQATLQTGKQQYLNCVIPSPEQYLDTLADATEFVISRTVEMPDGSRLECEMARSSVQTVQYAIGGTNYSATVSGYTDAAAVVDWPSTTARTLTGVQTIYSYPSGRRVRCSVDWLLRPGQLAVVSGDSFVVAFINYSISAEGDQFMDVGEVIEP